MSDTAESADDVTVLEIGPLSDLTPDSACRVDVDGHRLAVIRIGDDVYVIGDECSHADYSLSEGEIDPDDKTIECWKHGSAFSVETGEPTSMPAIKPVPVYTVRVEDGIIRVEVSS